MGMALNPYLRASLFWCLMVCGTYLVAAFAERYLYVLWGLMGLVVQLLAILILIGGKGTKSMVHVLGLSLTWQSFVVVPLDFFIKEFYVDYEFAQYGDSTVGYSFYDEVRKPVATETGRRVRYFYYVEGQEIEREVESDIYRSGDSLRILYSKRHPDLHRILGRLGR